MQGQRGSFVRLGSVSDPQNHDVAAREGIDYPILTDSELEKAVEVSMEFFARFRIAFQNHPNLPQDSLDIIRSYLPEIATDG